MNVGGWMDELIPVLIISFIFGVGYERRGWLLQNLNGKFLIHAAHKILRVELKIKLTEKSDPQNALEFTNGLCDKFVLPLNCQLQGQLK